MKSFVLTGLGQMELRDAPDPVIHSPHDVLIKITAVGVCGSDIHYYKNGRIGSQAVDYPFAVGHECAGRVVATGAEVHGLKAGDRVAIDPAMACGACDQCLAGRQHTCRNLRFLGCPGQAPGCLSEYIVMPTECCYPVGANVTDVRAALSEPLAIGYYAARLAQPLKGAAVAVLGCGPIGLSAMLSARVMGAARILATDPIPERRQTAASHAADTVLDPAAPDFAGAAAAFNPLLMDAVFECCGKQEAVDQALDILRPGGSLMLVGIPEADRVSVLIEKARRKEIRLQNVRRQCECVRPTLSLMEAGRLNGDFMVTHRFAFAETKKAFDLVASYADGVVKAMIDFAP